jgi:hypothetical protein
LTLRISKRKLCSVAVAAIFLNIDKKHKAFDRIAGLTGWWNPYIVIRFYPVIPSKRFAGGFPELD